MASISELGSYTWRIKDWASHTRDERLESIPFTAGGMTWCVAPLEGCTISRGDLVMRSHTIVHTHWRDNVAHNLVCVRRFLSLRPQGKKEESRQCLSLFLYKVSSSSKLEDKIDCSFRIILRAWDGTDLSMSGAQRMHDFSFAKALTLSSTNIDHVAARSTFSSDKRSWCAVVPCRNSTLCKSSRGRHNQPARHSPACVRC